MQRNQVLASEAKQENDPAHFGGKYYGKHYSSLEDYYFDPDRTEPLIGGKYYGKHYSSLEDYYFDPDRTEPLIGIQYAVKYIVKGRKQNVYQCGICDFSSDLSFMITHFHGIKHRKHYMQLIHPNMLIGFEKCKHKSEKLTYIRAKAKAIESMETFPNLKIACINTSTLPPKHGTRKRPLAAGAIENGCREHQKKQIVQYLETFKISSRSEAYTFLNLTQTLSEALKEYHVQSKGHNVLELGESLGMSTGSSEPMSDHIKQNKDRDGEENDVESAGFGGTVSRTENPKGFERQVNTLQCDYLETAQATSSHPFSGPSSPRPDEDSSSTASFSSSSSDKSDSSSSSSSNSSGNTSKTLTPDILQLLKGKDVDTVTEILQNLASHYPALQDVNLEMFAQILFQTGALD